jgi:hypothetical protein
VVLGIVIGRGVGSQIDNFWLGLLVSAIAAAVIAVALGFIFDAVMKMISKNK